MEINSHFYMCFHFHFKIRPLMDGNSAYTFTIPASSSTFKIRPLMDGNRFSTVLKLLKAAFKIRPLMDGNNFFAILLYHEIAV